MAEYRPARKEPQAGDNVYLTIDFDLQRRAEQYFIENEFVGSAVALDPRNGEVLAMVSSPAFNPNVYPRRFTPEVLRTIASNPFKVELNRAIQGLYSPGSVFKAVMAMAGLSEAAIDTSTSFFCSGSGVFFASPFGAGNSTAAGVRTRIILDVLDDVRRQYRIDPAQTYITGFSGGGRMACAIGFALPEYFGGVAPICGTNPIGGSAYLRHRAEERLSVAFVTGEKDFNRVNTKSAEEHGFRKEGFASVHYLEVPGLGHALPEAKWLEEGLKLLDDGKGL